MDGHDRFCSTLDKHLIRAYDCSNCCRARQIRHDERKRIIQELSEIDWTVPFEGHNGFFVDDKGTPWIRQSFAVGIVEFYGPR